MPREARLRRRQITPRTRAEVISRDGMICRHCSAVVVAWSPGDAYRPDHLHLDHVTPWAHGGADEADNLVVSCAACNLARPRPAHGAAAAHRLLWRRDGDEFYWRDAKYRPPNPVDYRLEAPYHFTPVEVAEILSGSRPCAPEDVIVMSTQGTLRGTTGTSRPIRIVFPGGMRDYVEARMDELGWEE